MRSKATAELEDQVPTTEAVEQVAGARHVLKTLRNKLEDVERRAELDEAITKLEMALSYLTIKTGGIL